MSTRILTAATIILLCCQGAVFSQEIAWRLDLATAKAEAAKSGKMMMVDVYTDWCTWCKKLDSDTYTDGKVIAQSAGFIPLKINPEKGSDENAFAKKYGVSGYPTILFVDADGTLANKVVGYLDGPGFAAAMKKTAEYAPKVKAYLAEYAAGRYGNSRELLSMLVALGRLQDAQPVFDTLRTVNVLDKSAQEGPAFALAEYFYDESGWEQMLYYLKVVEEINSGTDVTRQAHLMHSVGLFYTKGKAAGMQYLDALLKNARTPESWKAPFKDLRAKMEAAKE